METAGGAFKDWHDFYLLIGTASGSLVGLTFVATTIGAGILTSEREAGVQAFITPTLVHFSAILFACLFILAPFETPGWLAAVLLAEGLLGTVYSGWVVRLIWHRGFTATLVRSDHVWYALAPSAGYGLLTIAAAALLGGHRASLALLACALGLLLVAGIHNAWDMAVWFMLRPPSKKE